MNIDQRPVPDAIVAQWRAAVARFGDEALRTLSQVHKELVAGFRPNKANPTVVRTRALAAFDRLQDLPETWRGALQEATLANSLLRVLSEEAIAMLEPQLEACFGTGRVLASMLVDDREAVRSLGFATIERWDGTEPGEDAAHSAAAALTVTLGPFLEHLKTLDRHAGADAMSEAAAPAAPAALAPPGPARGERGREREMATELRRKRQEANRLGRELEAATREAEQLRAQVSGLARTLAAATAEHDARAAELVALRADVQGRIDEEVARRVDARLLPWLRPAETLQAAAEDPAGTDLLQSAQRLLQRQAGTDRLFGLRSRLQDELAQCEAMQTRLQAARVDAISPLPELSPMVLRLEQRMDRVRRILGVAPGAQADDDPALAALQRALSNAESLDALAALRRSLEAAEPLGLLSGDTLQRGYAAIRTAASRLYARAGSGIGAPASQLDGLPLYALQAELTRNRECTLVVDGHNVLFSLPTLFRDQYTSGLPGARARQALEQKLVTLGTRHPTLTIHVWFDSGELGDRSASGNVRVHFSGGTGENRADRRIVEYLTHLQGAQARRQRAVVTRDRAIVQAAVAAGAMAMVPWELAAWLDAAERE